jgi:hypothetical protein
LPHALYIRILSFIINTSHRDATDRIGGSANASEAILVVLKNLIHGVLPNAHQRVVNNLWVDGPSLHLNLTWGHCIMDHNVVSRRRTWDGESIWARAWTFIRYLLLP